jgi:TP901 family phage tail tape measure protein
MQTQYVALGKTATGASQAMALTPNHLNKMAAASAIATQRQVLMNRMIDLGSTKLLNWGKNTQWAGRQLMVGFSLPLAMLGTVAAKTFKELDQSSISFKRVYGDLKTTTAEMERNLAAVKELGMEYTKYGKSLSSTIELAATVAATGAQGESLTAATEQTIRLATLGLMEYDEALGATIALQTAFGVSNEDLSSTIDFLNVTENETILTMQDMAAAIPRVAPVVKGLGGDIKDLAVMMTAMREGGVTAEQGANAIKSGLARMINPTKAAKEQLMKFGISLDSIVQTNRGDLMGTINDFATALSTLDEFEQQQSLEKVFGKYQYARLGALFKNIAKDGSQAQRTVELTNMSIEDLASISERELSKIEEATSTKFAAAMERLKVSIAPIGETFMKAIMPIIDFVAKIANSFNELPEGIKSAVAIAVGAIAGIGPIVLMTIGLFANGIANIVKLTQTMRKFFARLRGDTSAFQHLTAEEHEARGAADALSRSTDTLTGKFLGQRKALDGLIGMLGNYSKALNATVLAAPMMMGVGKGGGGKSIVSGPASKTTVTRGYAKGVTSVPGVGNKDTVPALLTPGESVVTKEATQKYAPIIAAMNAGTIPGFADGVLKVGSREFTTSLRKGSNIDVMQAEIDRAISRLTSGGMNLASAIETVGDRVEQTIRELGTTVKGEMKSLSQSKLSKDLDSSVPRPMEQRSLHATHITPAIPASDPRMIAALSQDTDAALGKKVMSKIFPESISGTTQLTISAKESTNLAMKPGGRGATPAEIQEISNRGLLPSLSAKDPTILDDKEAILASERLTEAIKSRALTLEDGTARQKIMDTDLAAAAQDVLDKEISRTDLSPAERKVLSAADKSRLQIGEIRGGPTSDQLRNAGDLVRRDEASGRWFPNYENPELRALLSDDELAQARRASIERPSTQELGRTSPDGKKRWPSSPLKIGEVTVGDEVYRMGRPKPELSPAQQERVSRAMGEAGGTAQNLGSSSAESFDDGARREIGAASPATQGTNLIDDYVDGMKVGVSQNSAELKSLGSQTGETYDQSVKRAILEGGPVPPLPPGTVPPTVAGDGGPDRPESDAARQAREIKQQITGAKAITIKERSEISKNVRGISKEVGVIFRLLPQTAKEIARNFKESGKIIGGIISQIAAPYVKPIIDAFNVIKTNVYVAKEIVVANIKKIPVILKGAVDTFTAKVKGSYEMLALRTSIAMDSIKGLPAKVKSAYETAAIRTMMALDSIKKLPETMKNTVADLQRRFNDFRTNLPQNLMRARNQAFYRGQDLMGRGREAFSGIRERFAGMRERFSASNAYAAASLREGSLRSAARSYVPDAAAAQVKTMSEQITKAATTVKNQLTQTAQNVTNSARLAKILLKDGDIRGAIRAMTPDKVAQAFTAATKPIMDASKFAYGKMVDGARFVGGKLSEASNAVSKKFSEISGRVVEAGKNFANSVKVAGDALAMRDPRTALRALTPDRLAGALGNVRDRASQMYTTAKERVGGIYQGARATGITAYNALLARDVKTFVKALTPDRVWAASSKLVSAISDAGLRVASAGKFAYDTIIFNTKAALALGPGIIKDGFNAARGAIVAGAKFVKDTILVNFRAAAVVGASELKKAFTTTKTFISQGGKFILDTIKLNIGAALYVAKDEIKRIGTILRTEGPKLRASLGEAVKGSVGAIKGAGVILADSIRSVGSLVRGAGVAAAQGIKGFLQGGVNDKGQNRGQRMAGAGNNAMMGLMGISMAASFAGGEIGEMAQKIMPVTMGLMGLQMIIPMLTNPLGLAILATTALVGGFIYLRKQLDDTAKEAAKLGANMGGVANGMQVVEDATGFVAPTLQDRLFRFSEEDRKAMSEFSSYFESDAGIKLVEELKETTAEERYQRVSYLLAQGIATGLDPEKAKAFGKAIAEATGDTLLSANLAKDFAKGFFREGSQALIDLAGDRLKMAPEIGVVNDERQLRSGESLWDQQKRTRAEAYRSLSLWQEAIDAPLALMSALGGMLRGRGTQDLFMPFTEGKMAEELVAESAKGLGFALQMLQDITNAEAILAEERRSGAIAYGEAEAREAEIKALRDETESYIRTVLENGADTDSMAQAFGDQLSFRGFSEEQITRITETFSPDALAKRFFGADYKELDNAQKKYVDEVFSKTMSGLDPDNVSQRLQDVEGRWSEIAQEVLSAMRKGADVDIGAAFTEASFRESLSSREGVGRQTGALQEESGQLQQQKLELEAEMNSLLDDITEAQEAGNDKLASSLIKQRNRVVAEWQTVSARIEEIYAELSEIDPSESISKNLTGAEEELEKLGLTTEEVATRFLEFVDEDFMKELGNSEDGFIRLGKAIKTLGEYEDIDLEVILKQNIDPDAVAATINRVKDIKIDKDVFGSAALDADQITMAMINAGVEVEKIPGLVAKNVGIAKTAITSLGDEAKNKLGNIKVNTEIVTTLFGEQEDAAGLSNALESAFPKGLSPIQIPLLLSIMNPEMLEALAGLSPEIMDFIRKNPTATTYSTGVGTQFRRDFAITPAARMAVTALDVVDKYGAGGLGKTPRDKNTSGSTGGGSKEKTYLEQLQEDLKANASLYLTTTKASKKYGKDKANFFGVFQELRKKFNLPEGLIASFGEGAEGLAKAVEFLKASKKERKNIINLYKEVSVGQAIENLRRKREERRAGVKAANILTSAGLGITAEQAKEIASDSDLAFKIIAAAAKGNKKELKRLLNLIKTEIVSEMDTEDPLEKSLDEALNTFNQTKDLIDQGFDDLEQKTRDTMAADFAAKNGQTVAEMERQVVLNQRLIDQEQDKIDKKQEQINDYQRENDVIQQGIDDLKRNDELRNRVSAALSYDLEQMAKVEQDIREAYDKKVESLEKIESINQRIIEQQRGQLSLAQALSEGDIYAATQAAQEMRATDAQFAMQNTKDALQKSMENQIESLANADGLTRKQIEEQISSIKEQSYQASLMIRAEEDKIYANSLLIRDLTNEIYNINEDKIEPLQNQNKEYERILSYHSQEEEYAVKNLVLAGMTREEWNKKADALQRNIDNASKLDPWLRTLIGDYVKLEKAARAAADQAARTGGQLSTQTGISNMPAYVSSAISSTGANAAGGIDYSNMDFSGIDFSGINFGSEIFSGLNLNFGSGGMVKYAKGGMVNPLQYTSNEKPPTQMASGGVAGNGSRDSVPAMLTPGEYVIRKAMVDKYGIPMLSALNQGAFSMPKYNVGETSAGNVNVKSENTSNIMSPMYNNYSVSVNVANTNANPDEIANKVMFKMRQINNQNIRSNRG